jgi:transposase
LPETLTRAQAHLLQAGSEVAIKDVPADKGYHSNDNLTWCQSFGIRTYIPERASPYDRRWTDKPVEQKHAVYGNRRRVKGKRGKQLGRLRSEYTERSFAHVCETGGARRSRLRGLIDVGKRYLMYVAGRNLGGGDARLIQYGNDAKPSDGRKGTGLHCSCMVYAPF